MGKSWNRRGWHYALLAGAGACLFLVNLGGATLWDLDEGKNASCTWEMLSSGNFIVPTQNGELRVDKPALLYWLQAAAYCLFGIQEFAARLPSAVAALLTVFLAYELGRSLFGKTTGLLGALIAATTPMLCAAARFANPDALLHLFTLLTLFIFWIGYWQPRVSWWMAMGAAAGLGMLAKGPVAIVLPGAVAFLFLLWERRLAVLWDRRLFLGSLACAAVALPWYVWVAVDTKASFLTGFLGVHNVGRFTNTMEGHSGSVFYYPLVLLAGMAPWSIFAFGALWCAIWSARNRPPLLSNQDRIGTLSHGRAGRLNRWAQWAADRRQIGHPEVAPLPASAYRFLLVWIATYILFFTVAATKLPNYVLPVVVPCAIVTARFLDRWRRGDVTLPDWFWRAAFVGLLLFGLSIAGGLLAAGGVGEFSLLRGRFVPGLAAWAWIGLVPVLGALFGWLLWRRQRPNSVVFCLTMATGVFVMPMAAWASAAFNRVKAPAPLVAAAGAHRLEEDIRIAAWDLEHLPSLNFYTQRDVIYVHSATELDDLLRYSLPVYVFLPARYWDACPPATRNFGQELGRHPDFYRHREVVVVTNLR